MEILNIWQIIWQALNFLILYFVIAKFVVPPTKRLLVQRETEIAQGLENAEKARKQLEDAQKHKDAILAEARQQAQQLLEEMKQRANELSVQLEAEARVAAQEESKRILAQTEREIEKRKDEMEKEIIELSLLVVRKALPKTIDMPVQHDLLKSQIESLKKIKITP